MAFFSKRYHPPGTPAGTLKRAEQPGQAPLVIHLVDYLGDRIEIRDDVNVMDCRPYFESGSVTWIHLEGRPTETALRELGDTFGLHALALEDVVNTGQRPKIEPFDDQLFIVMSLPLMKKGLVHVEQISIFLCDRTLISFCEGDFGIFQPIIKRLQDRKSRLRGQGVDFLLYTLVDLTIDQGFPVLENFGLQLEELEEEILQAASRETLGKIHVVKRELILLRRMLWPQREVISQLQRESHDLIHEDMRVYLRDCYDHTVQVMDLLETYRDMTTSMLDIYLSSVSNRMNDIMRMLTVIATIFIPLTFLTGVYGMNFDPAAGPWSMPELDWPYGYVMLWLVMVSSAVAMILFFRRRGWF